MKTYNPLAMCCIMLAVLISAGPARAGLDIYHDGWIDLNKNGTMDPYEDPSVSIERRIDDLIGRMNLDEKTCQLVTLYGYNRVLKDPLPTKEWKNEIWKDGLANIDEHLNGVRGSAKEFNSSPSRLAESLNTVQRFFIEQTRLGIPVDFTNEGIRGLCARGATPFPAQIGIGSSWDVDLVSKIGHVTGKEARMLGYSNIYAPILDLARDPRWGRTVESYGEDPYLLSRLGVAMVKAIQAEGVASTVKHFCVYSVPKGGRDGGARTDPHVAFREFETMYLAPFRAAFTEGGALGTMSSYNDYDGVPITGGHEFLIDRLRKQWGFKGYVVSDSNAVKFIYSKHRLAADYKDAVRQAVLNGLNVRTEFNPPKNYVLPLRELVREGAIPMDVIDSRVRDVLRVKYLTGKFDRPYVKDLAKADKVLHCDAHKAVSLEASRKSIVLLKNKDNLLPLDRKTLKSILVTGPNAAAIDYARSRYGPDEAEIISVLDGIKNAVGDRITVKYAKGCDVTDPAWPESEILPEPMTDAERDGIMKAQAMAKTVDAAIVVVGGNENTVGESESRTSLDLPGRQRDLVKAIVATGTPTVVVLINGRPLTINWINKYVPAIIEAWFPGEWSGQAVAEVLFGDYNPGGKLSITFPKTVGQIPLNFPFKPGSHNGQPSKYNTRVKGVLYPFGYGLSYTEFKYSNLRVSPETQTADGTVTVRADVTNTGDRAGDEVVQLYVTDELSSVTTYESQLRGFKRISLEPGQTRTVEFTLDRDDLKLLDRDMKWTVEKGFFKVMVGSSSVDIRLEGRFEIV
ncbi:MAG: glycoside hydrolase family 3 C-terminal domain-containing protein [Candidatus Hydrogenedentes bacterium]|nr:glycoside hydrolase family 3 C-terminal domain-containing protein [Candidatus Hydrogenedentota bacterium]